MRLSQFSQSEVGDCTWPFLLTVQLCLPLLASLSLYLHYISHECGRFKETLTEVKPASQTTPKELQKEEEDEEPKEGGSKEGSLKERRENEKNRRQKEKQGTKDTRLINRSGVGGEEKKMEDTKSK